MLLCISLIFAFIFKVIDFIIAAIGIIIIIALIIGGIFVLGTFINWVKDLLEKKSAKREENKDNDVHVSSDANTHVAQTSLCNAVPTNDSSLDINHKVGNEGEYSVACVLEQLQGIHRVINDITIEHDNTSTQIDHVVITEKGVFCIETKNWLGRISGKENYKKWYQWYPTTSYDSEADNEYMNPLIQNRGHVAVLKKIFDDNNINSPIKSIVVMANNNANYIKVKNVINVDEVKDYVDNYYQCKILSLSEIERIANVLNNCKSTITNEQHVANIQH